MNMSERQGVILGLVALFTGNAKILPILKCLFLYFLNFSAFGFTILYEDL